MVESFYPSRSILSNLAYEYFFWAKDLKKQILDENIDI